MLRLKFLRISQGLTQWTLSQKAEISSGRYSMIERGLIQPTDAERDRIARVLKAEPTTLLHKFHHRHSPVAAGVE